MIGRRSFLSGAITAAGVVVALAAGCWSDRPFRGGLTEYGPTLRDHGWMWGHDSGRYDGRGNKYNIPTSEPISMADACAYMGIPNVCAVTWNEPSGEYLKPFAKLKRVSWVACGEKRQDQDVLRERAFRLAEKLPNLMGLDLACEQEPEARGGGIRTRLDRPTCGRCQVMTC